MYPQVQLYIDGVWRAGSESKSEAVINPATGMVVGYIPHASRSDLDAALAGAKAGFEVWRKTSPYERNLLMCRGADIIRSRADAIAKIMTLEQGKPLAESKGETLLAADLVDWFAEESRRTYGQVVPARASNVIQLAARQAR